MYSTILAYLSYFLNEKNKLAIRCTTLKVVAQSSACLCICRKYQVWSLELCAVEEAVPVRTLLFHLNLKERTHFHPLTKYYHLFSELRKNPRDHLLSRTGKHSLWETIGQDLTFNIRLLSIQTSKRIYLSRVPEKLGKISNPILTVLGQENNSTFIRFHNLSEGGFLLGTSKKRSFQENQETLI
jgi:hypothetical protein